VQENPGRTAPRDRLDMSPTDRRLKRRSPFAGRAIPYSRDVAVETEKPRHTGFPLEPVIGSPKARPGGGTDERWHQEDARPGTSPRPESIRRGDSSFSIFVLLDLGRGPLRGSRLPDSIGSGNQSRK
jgi:hypothetical protein